MAPITTSTSPPDGCIPTTSAAGCWRDGSTGPDGMGLSPARNAGSRPGIAPAPVPRNRRAGPGSSTERGHREWPDPGSGRHLRSGPIRLR